MFTNLRPIEKLRNIQHSQGASKSLVDSVENIVDSVDDITDI